MSFHLAPPHSPLVRAQADTDEEFMAEIMEMFLGDMASKKVTLSELCGADPIAFDKIGAIAHQFKGSSANLGVVKVVRVAVEMKEHCDSEKGEDVKAALKDLVGAMEELQGHFERYIRSVAGSQGEVPGAAPTVSESEGAAAARGEAEPQPSASAGGAVSGGAANAAVAQLGTEAESAPAADTKKTDSG